MITSVHVTPVRSLPPGAVLLVKSPRTHLGPSLKRRVPPFCKRRQHTKTQTLLKSPVAALYPLHDPLANVTHVAPATVSHVAAAVVSHVPPAVVIHVAPAPLLKAPRIMAPEDDLSAKQKVKNLLDLQQIVIIRHGEKTGDVDIHLNAAGNARANALPDFLLGVNTPWKRLHRDSVVIYAMKERDADGSSEKGPGSLRPLETVQPLAERLGLTIKQGGVNHEKTFYNDIRKDKTEKLAESILDGSHKGKTVLVCWEHTAEIDIANRLGIPVIGWGLDPFTKNDGKNFTAIWLLTPDGNQLKFEVLSQFEVDPVTLAVTYPEPSQTPSVQVAYDQDQLKSTMKHAGKEVADVALPVAA